MGRILSNNSYAYSTKGNNCIVNIMWAKDKVKLNENWDISLFSLSLHIYICLPLITILL